MRNIHIPSIVIALIISACGNGNNRSATLATTQTPEIDTPDVSAIDSVLYFADLEAEEVLKMMIPDSVPELKKVTVKTTFGDSTELLMDLNETSFYEIADVFYYNPVDGKPQSALVIFADYYGEHTDEGYRLSDSHGSGPAIFYGIYDYKENKGWYVVKKSNAAFNNAFKHYGQYGVIGDIGFIRSGKKRYALDFSGSGDGQGYTAQYISYYDIALEREVFSLSETTSNSGVALEEEAYAYSFSADFIESDNEYFDLKVSYQGTAYETNPDTDDEFAAPSVVPLQKTVMYSYEPRYKKYIVKK